MSSDQGQKGPILGTIAEIAATANLMSRVNAVDHLHSLLITIRHRRFDQLKEVDHFESRIYEQDPVVAESAALAAKIEAGLTPATRQQVEEEVILLDGVFTSRNDADERLYIPTVVEHVLGIRPSHLAVATGFAKLRSELKWAPNISAVLKTVREEDEDWPKRLGKCRSLASEVERGKTLLQEERRRLESFERPRRGR